LAPLASSIAGKVQEHGRTIPLAET